jgi:hypothetical protein
MLRIWRCAAVVLLLLDAGSGQYGSSSGAPLSVNYNDLMLQWARTGTSPASSLSRCIKQQAAQAPRQMRAGIFWTIGVEGAGHHMLMAMDTSLCPGSDSVFGGGCGGEWSFPFGMIWRAKDDRLPVNPSSPCIIHEARKAAFIKQPTSKFIFLLRDPVDAAMSAMGRFWHARQLGDPAYYHSTRRFYNNTLMGELAATRLGWRKVAQCLDELPCDRSLILSYELLTLFPEAHAPRLAAFLGVSPTDTRLRTWLSRIHSVGDASVTRAKWMAAALTANAEGDGRASTAPGPCPYNCSSPNTLKLAGKLRDEVALWHRHTPEYLHTERWLSDLAEGAQAMPPFPWSRNGGAGVVLPPWARACDYECLQNDADLRRLMRSAKLCVSAFRAAVRQWYYGGRDVATDAFSRAPLSSERCA